MSVINNSKKFLQTPVKTVLEGRSFSASSFDSQNITERLAQNINVIEKLNNVRLERSKSRRKTLTEGSSPGKSNMRNQLINKISIKLDSVIPVKEVPSPPVSRNNSRVKLSDKIKNLEGMLQQLQVTNQDSSIHFQQKRKTSLGTENQELISYPSSRLRDQRQYSSRLRDQKSYSSILRLKFPTFGDENGYRYPKYLKPDWKTRTRKQHSCHCKCHKS